MVIFKPDGMTFYSRKWCCGIFMTKRRRKLFSFLSLSLTHPLFSTPPSFGDHFCSHLSLLWLLVAHHRHCWKPHQYLGCKEQQFLACSKFWFFIFPHHHLGQDSRDEAAVSFVIEGIEGGRGRRRWEGV